MTCIVCGRQFSWSRLEKVATHVHLVLEADLDGDNPPCGIALGADVEGEAETFVCLADAKGIGRAAENPDAGRATWKGARYGAVS